MNQEVERELGGVEAATAVAEAAPRCIFAGCVSTWRHWHGGFYGGYDNPDDPDGPPIPFEGDDPEPLNPHNPRCRGGVT